MGIGGVDNKQTMGRARQRRCSSVSVIPRGTSGARQFPRSHQVTCPPGASPPIESAAWGPLAWRARELMNCNFARGGSCGVRTEAVLPRQLAPANVADANG